MDSTHAAKDNFRTPERWNSVPVPDRVAQRAYERIDKTDDGCWISRYSVASHGYSQVGWQNKGSRHVVLGHRAAWVHVNGQVPLSMTLDHLCKNRRCVNPDHLRLLPNIENARRNNGDDFPHGYCKRGHPDSMRVEMKRRTKDGQLRIGTTCGPCLEISRNKWLSANPEKRRASSRRHYLKRRSELQSERGAA